MRARSCPRSNRTRRSMAPLFRLQGGASLTAVKAGGDTSVKYKAISAHFALEERFMREKGYDQLGQHKGDHERLVDEIRDIMEDYEVNDLFDEKLLAQRLDAWVSRHFESHDARLHRAFGGH